MNDLQIFSNPEFGSVRTLEIEGEPWWVLKDVCEILEISNPSKVANRLDEDEVSNFELPHPQNNNKSIEMLCINESGLYNVIIRSDKPNAKAFRKWITSEVIPSIRKTGGYGIPQMSQSELILKIAQNNLDIERRLAEAENQTKAVSERLDNALDVFTQPVAKNWKDETNNTIKRLVEQNHLNHGIFRRKLYDELEELTGCRLEQRRNGKRKRMTEAGATAAERNKVSLIDVIAEDEKLKLIFDGIVKKYVASYAANRDFNDCKPVRQY